MDRDDANVDPRSVSSVNPALKEPDEASTSKQDILKEYEKSSTRSLLSRSYTVSHNSSVASRYSEPSNKQQHDLPVKEEVHVKGYCYATPFSSYAHELYPQRNPPNFAPAARRSIDNSNLHTRNRMLQSRESNLMNEKTQGLPRRRWSDSYKSYTSGKKYQSGESIFMNEKTRGINKFHTGYDMYQSDELNFMKEKTRGINKFHSSNYAYQSGESNFMNEKTRGINKFHTSSNVYQSGDSNFMNEKTRGPRGSGLLVSRTSTDKDRMSPIPNVDQYNRSDFETDYDDAMFFVIKSFSEEDIHRSIKYKVWASTEFGNKKLDAAYHDALARSRQTGSRCPVFLFFSVNESGQFVGLAEMTGLVDFKKTMSFWQQDKWTGFFPVKWHIIKDIRNHNLLHIILENNENKPVTRSRDTQEIKFEQGCEMLTIFKSFVAKSSLLDDYSFYDKESNKKEARSLRVVSEAQVNFDDSKQDEADDGSRTSHKVKAFSRAPKQTLLDLANKLSLDSHSEGRDGT